MARKLKKAYPYLLIFPFLLFVFVIQFLPIIFSVIIAFTGLDARFTLEFNGTENFAKILGDTNLPGILANTFAYTLASLACILVLSLVVAILTQYLLKSKFFKIFYRTVWIILGATPTLLYVIFLKYIFDQTDYGLINRLLLAAGAVREPVLWFINNPMAIVVVGISFYSTSAGIILLSSAINNIHEELLRAAHIDGAGDFAVIKDVILPLLKWPILLLVISHTISLATGYTFIMLLTGGGPVYDTTTLSYYGYQVAFGMHQYGYGSAIALVIVVMVFVLTFVQLRLFRFDELIQKPRIEG